MGEALRRDAQAHRGRRRAAAYLVGLVAVLALAGGAAAQGDAPVRFDRGRFTIVAYPADAQLARSLMAAVSRNDTFPGLPRPSAHVLIAIAPDMRHFRLWVGPNAPEWGAAIAFPDHQRIVMQGSRAGSDAGDPLQVVRHELAHLALHEAIGDLPPRWFDEGYASYAAGEWGRSGVFAASLALAVRGVPPLDSLDALFTGGASQADAAYALSYRAVANMAALDPQRGLTLFFHYWKATGSLDQALRSAYGLTEPAFEQRWQRDARLHYGALALFANLTVGFALMLLVVLPFYLARRRRDRRRLAAMRAADEAAERAERARVIEELLREPGGEGGER